MKVEDYKYYYNKAAGRQDLRIFRDLLQVAVNQPKVDISNFLLIVDQRVDGKDEEGKTIFKTIKVTKKFSEVLEELKPKDNGDSV